MVNHVAIATDKLGIARMGGPAMPYLVQPWGHQLDALQRSMHLDSYGLFLEMGCGKSAVAINFLRWKFLCCKRLLRTLILGPPIVVENWRREAIMHSKIGDKVHCLEGSGKKRLEKFQAHRDEPAVFVTNYESLLMPELFGALWDWFPEAIVFDESHKLKNLKAKRTKLAIKLADQARYKLILTGTPILNTPLDMFSQFRVMDGGETLGKNFYVFRAQYFVDKNAAMPRDKYFPNWVPREGSFEELNAKIKPVSMVVKKADCLDLPPLVKQTVFVELSSQQQKLYNQMKKDFIAYVNDKACVATLAITKALRLQQIVSGFITLEGGEGEDRSNVQLKDNPRAQALKELLSDITPGAKCLVWAVFRENYAAVRRVCEELGVDYVEVHGEVSAPARQKAVDRFNTDPSCRVFLGHPQSGGIGINLVSASYSIFYSRSFSLENDLQAEARNYRGGSEIHEKVTRIDLVARGTIDELITEKLAAKVDVSDKVLRDIAASL